MFKNIPANERRAHYIKDPSTSDLTKSLSLSVDDDPNFGSKYIISFSGEKDTLPMWGMYAQNGQGISLGFNREALKTNGTLIDCLYNSEDLKAEKWISLLKANYERTKGGVLSIHYDNKIPVEWRGKLAATTHFSLFLPKDTPVLKFTFSLFT